MSVSLQLTITTVVIVLSGVQSVFGVGLLVFGTPTLLILGVPFEQVLAYLLPCSIVISFLQVRSGGGFALDPLRRGFLLFTAPLVLAGTVLILIFGARAHVREIVGIMLIITGGLRLLGPVRQAAGLVIRRRLPFFLALLGIIHGLSNLGGGVLALIVGSVESDKTGMRRQIAFGYGTMAVIQLATLAATTPVHIVPWLWLTLPGIAALSYLVVGDRLFRASGERAYQNGLTALIIAFGLALILS